MDETRVSMSRRGFLANLGKVAAGAAAGASALTFVATRGEAAPTEAPVRSILGAPVRHIDLDAAEKQGYDSFKRGLYWGGGTFESVTLGLGFPYTMVPGEAFKWAEGGTVGWGSQCGAVTGGSAALGLVFGATETTTELVNSLNKWYADEYAKGTNLCHVSVGNWGATNGMKLDTPEMVERCAKLTGSVARKVAELINTEMEGKLEEVVVNAMPAGNNDCLPCHGKGARQDSRAIKSDCAPCHPNQHKQ